MIPKPLTRKPKPEIKTTPDFVFSKKYSCTLQKKDAVWSETDSSWVNPAIERALNGRQLPDCSNLYLNNNLPTILK